MAGNNGQERKIDATPRGDGPDIGGHKVRNVTETEVWKQSTGSVKKIWTNYVNMLGERFQMLPRADQELFIRRLSIIVTMGATMILLVMFYSFLPTAVRLIALPLMLGGAYLAGLKIVTPIMISRYEQYLNREF